MKTWNANPYVTEIFVVSFSCPKCNLWHSTLSRVMFHRIIDWNLRGSADCLKLLRSIFFLGDWRRLVMNVVRGAKKNAEGLVLSPWPPTVTPYKKKRVRRKEKKMLKHFRFKIEPSWSVRGMMGGFAKRGWNGVRE